LRLACATGLRFQSTTTSQRERGLSTPPTRKDTPRGHVSSRHSPFSFRCQYSSVTPPSESAKSGIAPLPHRRLVSVSGPDTEKFLQGLVTNDVTKFVEEESSSSAAFYSAFLDARGRVLWDVFIYTKKELVARTDEWSCYIEVDFGEVEALVKHIRRHKLRSNIKIEVVDVGEIGVWAAWAGSPVLTALLLDDFVNPSNHCIASFTDPRSEGMGVRLLMKNNKTPEYLHQPVVDTQQYHLRRYLHGIPEGSLEMPREIALPMEYNIDLSSGINFKKGCYVGQELTIRTKHTGVVRKRILPVQLYTSDTLSDEQQPIYDSNFSSTLIPANGAEIKQIDEDGSMRKGRPAGKFISAFGNVGLCLVRLEMMTSMRVSAEGGTWKPGAQFGIQNEDGEVVKVQAFAPQWFRERERELWDKSRKRLQIQ
jgi:folate-binding protein YgfZ